MKRRLEPSSLTTHVFYVSYFQMDKGMTGVLLSMQIERGSIMRTFISRFAAFLATLAALAFLPATASAYTIDTSVSGILSGSWLVADESGWGVTVDHQYDRMFIRIFTYRSDGKDTRYIVGCQVLDDGCLGDAYSTSGGRPVTEAWNGAAVTTTKVGTVDIAFTDANNAVLYFNFGGVYGSKRLTRYTFATKPAASLPCSKCVTPALHYTEKVYALWDGGMPFWVTKTGAGRVANKTSIPGIAPVAECSLAQVPLNDGTVLADCVNGWTGKQVFVYIDPTDDSIHDYTGGVPAGIVWHYYYGSINPATPTWWTNLHVSDGWYFNPLSDTGGLYFKSDVTGDITLVREAPTGSNVLLLMSYTH